MVGSIFFIHMPYSDFTKSKGRPVLVLPLTSNLKREGIVITSTDLKDESIQKIKKELCLQLDC